MTEAVDMFENKSVYFRHFYYCWLNGSVTTKEMHTLVEDGMITEEERAEIMKNPRGNEFPDQV